MSPRTFAEQLKEARLEAGISQSTLARRAGLTGSYISLLESKRRPPPSPRVIRALSRVLGIASAPLLEAAALERSPPTVRRRLERMRKERGKVHKSRDRLLTTTLFHLSRRPRVVEPMAEFLDLPADQQALLGLLLGRVRKVRNLDEADARADALLEDATPDDRDALVRVLPRALGKEGDEAVVEADAPAATDATDTAASTPGPCLAPVVRDPSRREEVIERRAVDPDRWRPDLFFWRADSDETHPRIESGDLLLVDPSRVPAEGNVVLVRYEGRVRVGALQRKAKEVHILFPRPEIPPLRIPDARFRPLGVVIDIRRELA